MQQLCHKFYFNKVRLSQFFLDETARNVIIQFISQVMLGGGVTLEYTILRDVLNVLAILFRWGQNRDTLAYSTQMESTVWTKQPDNRMKHW